MVGIDKWGALALVLSACGGETSVASAPPSGAAATPARVANAPVQHAGIPRSGDAAPGLRLSSVEASSTGEFATWSLAEGLDPTGTSSPKGFLVAFMASWCGYCNRSLPRLVQLEKDNPDLEIVVVSIDDGPDAQRAELSKVRAAGLTGPVLAADGAAISTWIGGGRSVPKYYFIDHNGQVVGRDEGFGDKVEPLMPKQAARALRD